jgi:hypothetical protein
VKRVGHVVAFLVGLLATAFLLRLADAVPYWGWSRARHEHALANIDDYDVAFVGSSRMNFGIVPKEFDATLAQRGANIRSLNYAFSGARGHDIEAIVDTLLAQRPRRLRMLVVELCTYDQRQTGTNWLTDQDIEHHVPATLIARVCEAACSNAPLATKLATMQFALAHTACNLLRIGQGPRILSEVVDRTIDENLPPRPAPPDEGYIASDTVNDANVKNAATALATEAAKRQGYLAYKFSAQAQARLVGNYPLESLRGLHARIRAAGIHPVYVVMPTLYADFYGNDATAGLVRELDAIDLDTKEFHEAELTTSDWFDPGHLSRSGAEKISRMLAVRIAGSPVWGRAGLPALADAGHIAAHDHAGLWTEWRESNSIKELVVHAAFPDEAEAVVLGVSARRAPLSASEQSIELELPLLSIHIMARVGRSGAVATIPASILPAATFHVQAATLREGRLLGFTRAVPVEPRVD